MLASADQQTKAAENKVAARVESLEKRVMRTLSIVQKRLAKQDITLAKLAAGPTSPPLTETVAQWSEVVKRARGGPPKSSVNQEKPVTLKPPAKITRARPLVVIVNRDSEQFPELLKVMRWTVNPETTGNKIKKMRQTKTGALLIEINGGVDSAEIVRAEVARSLDLGTAVKMAEVLSPLEIRNLDGDTTKEEIMEAISVPG